ncbi:YidH family protein [Planctomicrobium sp. SH668]|uniref:YidH family protein n=1 Tax=Planctomicrobium sp. SH668 TaxID=3448126 RepID=UPI003F5B57FF
MSRMIFSPSRGDAVSAGGEQSNQDGDLSAYFSAERTLLAWVRTGLAMMGFGFVVARFGLFIREIVQLQGTKEVSDQGLSLWVGVLLVALGVVVNLFAVLKHSLVVRSLRRGEPIQFRMISMETVAAIVISLVGMLMVVYLGAAVLAK